MTILESDKVLTMATMRMMVGKIAEDNKNNLQQCDLDEAAYMTKSKTMLSVLMPLTRTMCSLVILMRQSDSIAAAGTAVYKVVQKKAAR